MVLAFAYYDSAELTCFSKEEKLILRKSLALAPSVIVSQHPEVGFAYFKKLIETKNKRIHSLIKENLKKKRLANAYQVEVEQLLHQLEKLN